MMHTTSELVFVKRRRRKEGKHEDVSYSMTKFMCLSSTHYPRLHTARLDRP